ncbi:DALR anticodon-binding domain-containing protein [Streptomyces sp. CS62]
MRPSGSPGTSSSSPTPCSPSSTACCPSGTRNPSAAHRARLALAEAAGAVLAGGLALLGIDAPDCL